MTHTIEAVYEDNVLKPTEPIKGLMEHEKVTLIIHPHPVKRGLREIAGKITHTEAEEMQRLIDEEFEKIEGEW